MWGFVVAVVKPKPKKICIDEQARQANFFPPLPPPFEIFFHPRVNRACPVTTTDRVYGMTNIIDLEEHVPHIVEVMNGQLSRVHAENKPIVIHETEPS